jgi:hypothetical protein
MKISQKGIFLLIFIIYTLQNSMDLNYQGVQMNLNGCVKTFLQTLNL